jgi:hypothetical protein
MRRDIDPQAIESFVKNVGRLARGPGSIYLTGGASALLMGWRSSTVDINIRLDPEPPGIFQAISRLKQDLQINIELASPQDFLPPLAGWRERSVFITEQNRVYFYHYDFTSQALSKLARGYERDMIDVQAMYKDKLFLVDNLLEKFNDIKEESIKYPSIKIEKIEKNIQDFISLVRRGGDDVGAG